MKTIYGPATSGSSSFPSADGNTLITDKEKILECFVCSPLHGKKKQAVDSHRGIFLLSIARNILARMLLKHLNELLKEDLLPESQCGFCQDYETVDMVFSARQF